MAVNAGMAGAAVANGRESNVKPFLKIHLHKSIFVFSIKMMAKNHR